MHMPPTVTQIEAAAIDAGLTVAELCRRARVNPATFYRWRAAFAKDGDCDMRVKSLRAFIEAINDAAKQKGTAHG